MKATTLLCQHHRKLEHAVAALASQPQLRRPLLLELAGELMAHIAIEKTILLPCAERALVGSLREHHATLDQARVLLRGLADAVLDDEAFLSCLASMRDVLRAHVEREESDMFPALERVSDEYSLARLGDRMSAFRKAMLKPGEPTASVWASGAG